MLIFVYIESCIPAKQDIFECQTEKNVEDKELNYVHNHNKLSESGCSLLQIKEEVQIKCESLSDEYVQEETWDPIEVEQGKYT